MPAEPYTKTAFAACCTCLQISDSSAGERPFSPFRYGSRECRCGARKEGLARHITPRVATQASSCCGRSSRGLRFRKTAQLKKVREGGEGGGDTGQRAHGAIRQSRQREVVPSVSSFVRLKSLSDVASALNNTWCA